MTPLQGDTMEQTSQRIEEHLITEKPFYLIQHNELDIALAAYRNGYHCFSKALPAAARPVLCSFRPGRSNVPL